MASHWPVPSVLQRLSPPVASGSPASQPCAGSSPSHHFPAEGLTKVLFLEPSLSPFHLPSHATHSPNFSKPLNPASGRPRPGPDNPSTPACPAPSVQPTRFCRCHCPGSSRPREGWESVCSRQRCHPRCVAWPVTAPLTDSFVICRTGKDSTCPTGAIRSCVSSYQPSSAVGGCAQASSLSLSCLRWAHPPSSLLRLPSSCPRHLSAHWPPQSFPQQGTALVRGSQRSRRWRGPC